MRRDAGGRRRAIGGPRARASFASNSGAYLPMPRAFSQLRTAAASAGPYGRPLHAGPARAGVRVV
jgi:hypothetical protein